MLERPLSKMERALVLLDEALPFNGLLMFRVRGPLTEAALRAALDLLQARHPLLRVTFDGARYVERAGRLPLHIVERDGDDRWRTVCEDALNTRFSAGGLLLRLTWVRGEGVSEIVISHHHLMADAHSDLYLARDLFTFAGAILDGKTPTVEPLPLRPPLEALLPKAARGLHLFGTMNAFLYRTIATQVKRPQRLRADEDAPPAARRNRIEHRALDAAESAALAARCKAEDTTVHGAIAAAVLLGAAADVGAPATLGCFSAVNLRGELTLPLDGEVGAYVSQVQTFHALSPTRPLWETARELRRELSRAIASGEQWLTLPNMGMFIPRGADPGPTFVARLERVSQAAVGVTNLGRIALPPAYGPLTLDEIDVCVGLSVVGRVAAAVGTFADRLTLNLMFVEPLVSRARAARIADRARALLVSP